MIGKGGNGFRNYQGCQQLAVREGFIIDFDNIVGDGVAAGCAGREGDEGGELLVKESAVE